MTKKSKRIITDAVVVIEAHQSGYWESLCNTYEIALPAQLLRMSCFILEQKTKQLLTLHAGLKKKKSFGLMQISAILTN